MSTHTWTARYFVRAATLRDALPRAKDRAVREHPDTPREAMMTPTVSARITGIDKVYGYDVTIIGKPEQPE
jgi:hypothetical protein